MIFDKYKNIKIDALEKKNLQGKTRHCKKKKEKDTDAKHDSD